MGIQYVEVARCFAVTQYLESVRSTSATLAVKRWFVVTQYLKTIRCFVAIPCFAVAQCLEVVRSTSARHTVVPWFVVTRVQEGTYGVLRSHSIRC